MLANTYIMAQCDNEIISTYPPQTDNRTGHTGFPPQNYNPQRPDMRNTFNWMQRDPGTGFMTEGFFSTSPFDGRQFYTNPFYSPHPFLGAVSNAAASDFHPEDGWELIQWGFGQMLNYTVKIADDIPKVPYIILYNKYDAVVRVWGQSNMNGSDAINIYLKFPDPNTRYRTVHVSATLSNNDNLSQPLDQFTKITTIVASARHPNAETWFYGDFKMAYDPCVCKFESNLEVVFETVEIADIDLNGRYIGTSISIDQLYTRNTPPYKINANFLASMNYDYDDDSTKSGMLIYNNINLLMNDYDKRMKDYKNEKRHGDQMKMWSTIFTIGAYTLGALKPPLGLAMKKVLKTQAAVDKSKAMLEATYYAASAAGKYTDAYASRLKESNQAPGLPSVLHGEMRIKGKLTDRDPTTVVTFGNPGSKNTPLMGENYIIGQPGPDLPLYPFYNEPLGIFALMETPQVNLYYGFDGPEIPTIDNGVDINGNPITPIPKKIYDRHRIVLKLNGDIKYHINPSTNYNKDATRVLFSLKMNTQAPNNAMHSKFNNFETRHIIDNQFNKHYFLQTPYLPASCFQSMISEIDFSNLVFNSYFDGVQSIPRGAAIVKPDPRDITLSVMVILESNSLNKDGDPNRAVHFFTYPVTYQDIEINRLNQPYDIENMGVHNLNSYTMSPAYPDQLTYQNLAITSIFNVTATNKVNFQNGNLTSSSTSKFTAGDYIEVLPEYDINVSGAGEVILEIFEPELQFNCEYDNTGLLSETQLEQQCTGNKYKANEILNKKDGSVYRKPTKDGTLKHNSFSIGIHPNPANTAFEITTNAVADYQISITDITGRVVLTVDINQGNKANLDVSQLQNGIYFVQVNGNGHTTTQKIIVRH